MNSKEVAKELKKIIDNSRGKYLKKNAYIDSITNEELVVLTKYFPGEFLTELFGGSKNALISKVTYYFKKRERTERTILSDDDYVSEEPQGLGGWKYAVRLERKVFKQLENVVNQGTAGQGLQLVNACKLMLNQTVKTKDDALKLMDAYQDQLLILSEHIAEKFLPDLKERIVRKLKNKIYEIKKELYEEAKDISIGKKELLDKMIANLEKFDRHYSLSRFELYFAKSLAKNKKTQDAFNFTKDLIENYANEEQIDIDSESKTLILENKKKRFIR